MRLTYRTDTGDVLDALPDKDIFWCVQTHQVETADIEIDELDPDNKALCIDLKATQGRYDAQGNTKYHIVDGVLHVRDGWQEAEPWL